ncbi:hypothetical protein Tco_1038853 [Tanacetum coccineum]
MLRIKILHNVVGTSGYHCRVLRSFPVERIKQGISNYGVICEDETKRRDSGAKTKTFEENLYLLLYAVSSKEDTAYQRQLITRIRYLPGDNVKQQRCEGQKERRHLFTYDIQGVKTYDEYAQELNNKTQGNEEPWSEIGVQHQCEPYRFKNGKAKWPKCNANIDEFCNGGELPGMVRVGTMTYFQDHSWYNELVDGKLKDETLAFKAKIEGSWGDTSQGVLKFCKWLKSCFENFHELEYESRMSNTSDKATTFGDGAARIGSPKVSTSSPLVSLSTIINVPRELYSIDVAATFGVPLNNCGWLKSCFEKFHELEYEVLVKLQECWWKVNTQEAAPFIRMEIFGRGPYANIKTEWGNNPHLNTNHISGRNHEASDVGCDQEDQEHKDDPTLEPSNCKVRRFEMMKYSINDDEEYITIKESEHLSHSKKSLKAYRELLRLINEGWVVTTPNEAEK